MEIENQLHADNNSITVTKQQETIYFFDSEERRFMFKTNQNAPFKSQLKSHYFAQSFESKAIKAVDIELISEIKLLGKEQFCIKLLTQIDDIIENLYLKKTNFMETTMRNELQTETIEKKKTLARKEKIANRFNILSSNTVKKPHTSLLTLRSMKQKTKTNPRAQLIQKISNYQQQFRKTLSQGMKRVRLMIDCLINRIENQFQGYQYYQTYCLEGLQKQMMKVIALTGQNKDRIENEMMEGKQLDDNQLLSRNQTELVQLWSILFRVYVNIVERRGKWQFLASIVSGLIHRNQLFSQQLVIDILISIIQNHPHQSALNTLLYTIITHQPLTKQSPLIPLQLILKLVDRFKRIYGQINTNQNNNLFRMFSVENLKLIVIVFKQIIVMFLGDRLEFTQVQKQGRFWDFYSCCMRDVMIAGYEQFRRIISNQINSFGSFFNTILLGECQLLGMFKKIVSDFNNSNMKSSIIIHHQLCVILQLLTQIITEWTMKLTIKPTKYIDLQQQYGFFLKIMKSFIQIINQIDFDGKSNECLIIYLEEMAVLLLNVNKLQNKLLDDKKRMKSNREVKKFNEKGEGIEELNVSSEMMEELLRRQMEVLRKGFNVQESINIQGMQIIETPQRQQQLMKLIKIIHRGQSFRQIWKFLHTTKTILSNTISLITIFLSIRQTIQILHRLFSIYHLKLINMIDSQLSVILYITALYAYHQECQQTRSFIMKVTPRGDDESLSQVTSLLQGVQISDQSTIMSSIQVQLYQIFNKILYKQQQPKQAFSFGRQLLQTMLLRYMTLMWHHLFIKSDSFTTVKLPYILYLIKQKCYDMLMMEMFEQQQMTEFEGKQNKRSGDQVVGGMGKRSDIMRQLFEHMVVGEMNVMGEKEFQRILNVLQPQLCAGFINYLFKTQNLPSHIICNTSNSSTLTFNLIELMVKYNFPVQMLQITTIKELIYEFAQMNLNSYCQNLKDYHKMKCSQQQQYYYINNIPKRTAYYYYYQILWDIIIKTYLLSTNNSLSSQLYYHDQLMNNHCYMIIIDLVYYHFQHFKTYIQTKLAHNQQCYTFYCNFLTKFMIRCQYHSLKDYIVVEEHNTRRLDLHFMIITQLFTIDFNCEQQVVVVFDEYMKLYRVGKSQNNINQFHAFFVTQKQQHIRIAPLHKRFTFLSLPIYISQLMLEARRQQSNLSLVQLKILQQKESMIVEQIRDFLDVEITQILELIEKSIENSKATIRQQEEQGKLDNIVRKKALIDYCISVKILMGFVQQVIQKRLGQGVKGDGELNLVMNIWQMYERSIHKLMKLTAKFKTFNTDSRSRGDAFSGKRSRRSFQTSNLQDHSPPLSAQQPKHLLKTPTIFSSQIPQPIQNYLNGLNNLQTTKNKIQFLLNLVCNTILPSHNQIFFQNHFRQVEQQRVLIVSRIEQISTVNHVIDCLNSIKLLVKRFQQQKLNEISLREIKNVLNYFVQNIFLLESCIVYKIQCQRNNKKESHWIEVQGEYSSSLNPSRQGLTKSQQTSINRLIGRKVFKVLPII